MSATVKMTLTSSKQSIRHEVVKSNAPETLRNRHNTLLVQSRRLPNPSAKSTMIRPIRLIGSRSFVFSDDYLYIYIYIFIFYFERISSSISSLISR